MPFERFSGFPQWQLGRARWRRPLKRLAHAPARIHTTEVRWLNESARYSTENSEVQKTSRKYGNRSRLYDPHGGYTVTPPGHHRGATGKTPLALARRNSGRTRLKQRKCFNCNILRNQPESVSQCLHLPRANKEKQRRPQRDAFVISATDCRRLSAGQYRH